MTRSFNRATVGFVLRGDRGLAPAPLTESVTASKSLERSDLPWVGGHVVVFTTVCRDTVRATRSRLADDSDTPGYSNRGAA